MTIKYSYTINGLTELVIITLPNKVENKLTNDEFKEIAEKEAQLNSIMRTKIFNNKNQYKWN